MWSAVQKSARGSACVGCVRYKPSPPVCRWCPCVPRVPQPSGDLGPPHRLRGQQDLLHEPDLLPQVQTGPHPPHSLDGRSSRCECAWFAFCMRACVHLCMHAWVPRFSVCSSILQTQTMILVCLPRSASRWSPRLLGTAPRASSSPGRRGGPPAAVPALLTPFHTVCVVCLNISALIHSTSSGSKLRTLLSVCL